MNGLSTKIIVAIAVALCALFTAFGVTMCSGQSSGVPIDLGTGTRRAALKERIRYSTGWESGITSGANAVVAVDGVMLKSETGTGYVEWTPDHNGTFTLTHKVMSGGVQTGETLAVTFLVDGLTTEKPVIMPASGTIFEGLLTVSISCPTEGATIHYTTDGSEPTVDSPVYKRFKISGRTTVKAIAVKAGLLASEVAVAEYALGQCGDVTIVAADSFVGSKTKVVFSCPTKDATIHYTLNGDEPNIQSAEYTKPFYVTESCTVKAYATKTDWLSSGVATHAIERQWGIGDALGKPDHGFTTDGTDGVGWARVVDTTAPNGEAMKSGAITHAQYSVLETSVVGPGVLTFSWRTSCEQDNEYEWDHAEFVVDGRVLLRLNGITDWKDESITISGNSEHEVKWRYVKDDAESEGEDAAWVAGYGWVSDYTETKTTEVPVPYAWLLQRDPEIVDEYEVYESAAKLTGENGHKVWESYAIGADPNDKNDSLKITSFPMKADGTPDVENIVFDPQREKWNVQGARAVLKGASELGGEWRAVTEENKASFRFFKVVVELP